MRKELAKYKSSFQYKNSPYYGRNLTTFLFVVIFHKSGSLVPCIVCHSIFNALSIFHIERFVYFTSIVLIVVPLVYAYYINKVVKE